MGTEVAVRDYTSAEAQEAVARFHHRNTNQRREIYWMYERNAHRAYGYHDFAEWCRDILGTEWKQQYVSELKVWAEIELEVFGTLAIDIQASLVESGTVSRDVMRELRRLPSGEARKATYEECVELHKCNTTMGTARQFASDIRHIVTRRLGEAERHANGGAAPFNRDGTLVTDKQAESTLQAEPAEAPPGPQEMAEAEEMIRQAEEEQEPADGWREVSNLQDRLEEVEAKRDSELAHARNLQAQLDAYTSVKPVAPMTDDCVSRAQYDDAVGEALQWEAEAKGYLARLHSVLTLDPEHLGMLDELAAKRGQARDAVVSALVGREWRRCIGSKDA